MLRVKEKYEKDHYNVEELIDVLRGLPPKMICKINHHNITDIRILYDESCGFEHVAIGFEYVAIK